MDGIRRMVARRPRWINEGGGRDTRVAARPIAWHTAQVNRGNKRPCESGLSASTLKEKYGVVVPDDVRICRESSTKVDPIKRFELVSASPSTLCLMSFELLDCPSLTKEGLRWTSAMSKRWDGGEAQKSGEDHLRMEFTRKSSGAVHLSLAKSRYAEVTADLEVHTGESSGGKAKKGGHGDDD
ncbi:MAG: hypothetical protein IPJ34_26630 [Myxococcales bacterium]|nr:hypothetical protein [Myxococcales bacterium]